MIQRKQTVFLLVAFVAMLICAIMPSTVPYLWIAAAIAAIGSLGNVFLYKRRPLQARLCIALIGLGLLFYVGVAVYQHTLCGQLVFTWPLAMPALAMVFWFMAYKGIMHDEKLVRSLDRIR